MNRLLFSSFFFFLKNSECGGCFRPELSLCLTKQGRKKRNVKQQALLPATAGTSRARPKQSSNAWWWTRASFISFTSRCHVRAGAKYSTAAIPSGWIQLIPADSNKAPAHSLIHTWRTHSGHQTIRNMGSYRAIKLMIRLGATFLWLPCPLYTWRGPKILIQIERDMMVVLCVVAQGVALAILPRQVFLYDGVCLQRACADWSIAFV